MDNREYTTGAKVFEEWEIVRKLGEGANGQVFEIHKTDFGITTRSALKVICIPRSESDVRTVMSEGMDQDSVTAYFQGFVDEIVKEIAVMSQLKGHPNIVSYEDHCVLRHDDGIGWDILIRMELLTPLTDYLIKNQSQVNEKMVLRLARELCSALAYCQSKKIMHRDIKPENIFVSENGHFKLGDFGIARTVEKTTGGLSKKGTESYMAPEVYLGKPYDADVDLYSLGLVLYKLLNGNRLPFLPPYPQPIMYSDREEAIGRRMRGEALPCPQNTSHAFADIILKACEFDREKRYRTAEEMLAALQQMEEQPKKQKGAEKPEQQETPKEQEQPGQTAQQNSSRQPQEEKTEQKQAQVFPPADSQTAQKAEPYGAGKNKAGNKKRILVIGGCLSVVFVIFACCTMYDGEKGMWVGLSGVRRTFSFVLDPQGNQLLEEADQELQDGSADSASGKYDEYRKTHMEREEGYTGLAKCEMYRVKDADSLQDSLSMYEAALQWVENGISNCGETQELMGLKAEIEEKTQETRAEKEQAETEIIDFMASIYVKMAEKNYESLIEEIGNYDLDDLKNKIEEVYGISKYDKAFYFPDRGVGSSICDSGSGYGMLINHLRMDENDNGYPTGAIYLGDIQDSMCEGSGVLLGLSGDSWADESLPSYCVIDGEWSADKANGWCVYQEMNVLTLKGQGEAMKNNRRNEGNVKDNLYDGEITMEIDWEDGEVERHAFRFVNGTYDYYYDEAERVYRSDSIDGSVYYASTIESLMSDQGIPDYYLW